MSDPFSPAHLYFLGYEFGSCPPMITYVAQLNYRPRKLYDRGKYGGHWPGKGCSKVILRA